MIELLDIQVIIKLSKISKPTYQTYFLYMSIINSTQPDKN